MLARTSFMACSYSAGDRPRPEMAEPNASMTMPSSRTVVPAMSRQAIVIGDHANVSSAMAGEHVMPRPPGPVTRTTPGSICDRWYSSSPVTWL